MRGQESKGGLLTVTEHWLDCAHRVVSPNCDARPEPIEISLIVVHCISLPPGKFDAAPVCEFFSNTLDITKDPYYSGIGTLRVSSHLYIDRLGNLIQFVPFHCRAWHAGQSVFRGRTACNDFSIGIELAGTDDIAYTQAQYRVLIRTIRSLQAQYPATSRHPVVGHCHIAPERKTDPGPAFAWGRLAEAGISVFTDH